MPEVELTAAELAYLRRCPQTLFLLRTARRPAAEVRELVMIKQLQNRRLIRAEIDAVRSNENALVTNITLTNAGRLATGLPVYAKESASDGQ